MSVQSTSAAALAANGGAFATLNNRIIDLIRNEGEALTRHEIAQKLGSATATISGRVRELIDTGKLIVIGKDTCDVTGNMVQLVDLAN